MFVELILIKEYKELITKISFITNLLNEINSFNKYAKNDVELYIIIDDPSTKSFGGTTVRRLPVACRSPLGTWPVDPGDPKLRHIR